MNRILIAPALAAACLASIVGVAAAAPPAPSGPKCSATEGQTFIDAGRYERAIATFSCLIDAQPTNVDGYRGRAEAELLLGRFSDAMLDYNRVTAFVVPVQPDAVTAIFAQYDDRLAGSPDDVAALTGATFARWWDFQYPQAIHLADALLDVEPDSLFGATFRGSSRLLKGVAKDEGAADLEGAIQVAPSSPDVRWIVADAYTYGQPDPGRAFAEASLALGWGLDTPRIHAILASAYGSFGDQAASAEHIARHIELVTTDLVTIQPLAAGGSASLPLVAGRTYAIPVTATAGDILSISTSSKDYWDSIAVLLAPDGTPVVGSDDAAGYFAAFEWQVDVTATYMLQATFFESLNAGELLVQRS